MAVVNTQLGPNSNQFDYNSIATYAEIFSALSTEIQNGHGWSLYDSLSTTSGVFRAQNKDGSTYKYAKVSATGSANLKINCQIYETWNATTHAGTNSCYGSDDALTTSVYGVNGQVYLFINPRWMAFTLRDPGTSTTAGLNYYGQPPYYHGGIYGCFEFTRDNPEDTVGLGLPCAGYLNTVGTTLPAGFFPYGYGVGSLPRLKNGDVGSNSQLDIKNMFGDLMNRTYDGFTNSKNPWNNQDWVLTFYAHERNNGYGHDLFRGKVYGLKSFSKVTGTNFLDIIQSKTDSDYLYSAAGTSKDHYIIPNAGSTSTLASVLIPR